MNQQIKLPGNWLLYCIDLSSASDTAQVGGEAANLAKAISLGMPVPI
jgi:phosphoenolpyruvate synthase/pyruvate phosphate dikinase